MQDFINQVILDVWAYKTGYGEKYKISVIEEINKLRAEICDKLQEVKGIEKINLEKLLYILDNDPNIKSKKGV